MRKNNLPAILFDDRLVNRTHPVDERTVAHSHSRSGGIGIPGAPPAQSLPVPIAKLFLTAEEAAQRLGVTLSWIYERTRRKAIPHRKLGKFVRFTEEDLQAISEAAATGHLL